MTLLGKMLELTAKLIAKNNDLRSCSSTRWFSSLDCGYKILIQSSARMPRSGTFHCFGSSWLCDYHGGTLHSVEMYSLAKNYQLGGVNATRIMKILPLNTQLKNSIQASTLLYEAVRPETSQNAGNIRNINILG